MTSTFPHRVAGPVTPVFRDTDAAMLNYAHEFAQQRELDPQLFEFEMLHGATPNRLKQMLDSGNRVRDYLVVPEQVKT